MNDIINSIDKFLIRIDEKPLMHQELKDFLNRLKENIHQYSLESVKWSVEDFTDSDDDDLDITPKAAQAALEEMIRKHDAELGISWITIGVYKEEYGHPKGMVTVEWPKSQNYMNENW